MNIYHHANFLILRRRFETLLYDYLIKNACGNSIIRLQEYLRVISQRHYEIIIINIINQLYQLNDNNQYTTLSINNAIDTIVNIIQDNDELIQCIILFINY